MNNESQQPQSQESPTTGVDLILLPGLHGSEVLFADFKSALQELPQDSGTQIYPHSVQYPEEESQSYQSLLSWLSSEIDFLSPREHKTVILAESFSTPLALMLADRYPSMIHAVIIAGGFVSSPIVNDTTVAALTLLPLQPLFMVKPPKAAIRHYLTGSEVSKEFVKNVQNIISSTPSKTISSRVRSVLDLDEKMCPNIPETPTLLLQAENDGIIPWETQNGLETHLSHAQSHWMQSPHFILQTHPSESAEQVLEFLETII